MASAPSPNAHHPDRRLIRFSLSSVLFAVAGFYVWYCAPIGLDSGNAALVALLGIAAAVCASLAVRLVGRQRKERATRLTVGGIV
jgi:hypothetical protein